jgi:3-hydroxymyristoyl/3-hydroxydecanoyl-(acyl carrier protein) dehydratase
VNPAHDADHALTSWRLVDATSAVGEVSWPATLAVFGGHFPGNPLVPGVHQLAVIALLAQRGLGCGDLRIAGVNHAKWLRPVHPAERLIVNAAWTTAENGWHVQGRLMHSAERCATCHLHLVRQPERSPP